MLEVIDRDAVGNEEQPLRQMNAAEPLGIAAEELLHVRPGEELQPHRVNLARFVRRPEIIDAAADCGFGSPERRAPFRA